MTGLIILFCVIYSSLLLAFAWMTFSMLQKRKYSKECDDEVGPEHNAKVLLQKVAGSDETRLRLETTLPQLVQQKIMLNNVYVFPNEVLVESNVDVQLINERLEKTTITTADKFISVKPFSNSIQFN